jgi:hypothetical protein
MPDPDIKPQNPHPPGWDRDMNPDFMAGQNLGQFGPHPELDAPTAYDMKEVHRQLDGFTDDELKEIPIREGSAALIIKVRILRCCSHEYLLYSFGRGGTKGHGVRRITAGGPLLIDAKAEHGQQRT